MAKTISIASLEAKKVDLQRQIKEIETAIRAAREKERAQKTKAIVDALASRGLLENDLDAVLAAIAKVTPGSAPASVHICTPDDSGAAADMQSGIAS